MRGQATIALVATAMTIACRAPESDTALAERIERQIVAAHPDVPLQRYARFYAREQDRSVSGVYLFSNVGYDPSFGKVGTIVWTTPEKLPIVYDGGCAVIWVRFDPARGRLTSLECGASG